MKITSNDPRLSAYLFGELSDTDSTEVQRALASDPALRLGFEELQATTSFLESVFADQGATSLLETQRRSVIRASREADVADKVVDLKSSRRGGKAWIGGFAAAAAVTLAALISTRFDFGGSTPLANVERQDNLSMIALPGPGGGDAKVNGVGSSGSASAADKRASDRVEASANLASPTTGSLPEFSNASELRLPAVLGTQSLGLVMDAISSGTLPQRDLVRVEELINSCAISGVQPRLQVATLACPWAENSVLVAVQVTAGSDDLADVTLLSSSGCSRRVLGSFATVDDQLVPTVLPADRRTLMLLEMIPDSAPGEVSLSTESGSLVNPISLTPTDSSDELDHAVVMATFGLWLRGEGVSAEQLAKVVEAAAADTDLIRTRQRAMISKALQIAR